MSSIAIAGDTSGSVVLAAPAVAGTNTLTLQAATATNSVNTLATAVASTSGTSIDFTGLPSWIKRITVMFNGVSTNGTSNYIIQIGSGSFITSGYVGGAGTTGGTNVAMSTGFLVRGDVTAANLHYGTALITNITGNTWIEFGNVANSAGSNTVTVSAGSLALSGTLDRIRITTVNGTDTFDAGTINILYEG